MKATFDPAAKITLHHRQGRAGSKKIIFKNSDGSPYNISAIAFRLLFNKSPHNQDVIELTEGNGLTTGGAGNNELTITLSETLKLWVGRYLWQLINDTIKKTWLNGPFLVHDDEFDSFVGSVDVTISTESEIIEVTITDPSGSAGVNGGTP